MKKKKNFTSILLVIILIAGLSLLLYPSFANYWNNYRASKVIASYVEDISNMKQTEIDEMWNEAKEYNEKLAQRGFVYDLNKQQSQEYESVLNIGGSGVMGYIEIDSLGVSLPIYHGTSDGVLQVAVGHLDWTSLPVGGESSHCVLSGHRGLPSAKLFTDLDQLREGDTFTLNVLDKVLTYEVDQIRVVKPAEVSELKIEDGKDYCTLVTCTPYGINTHRMLVRGHRIETKDTVHVVSEATVIEPMIIAPILALPVLLVLLGVLVFKPKKNRKKRVSNGGNLHEKKNK
ncbi:MAG: class C sortase [Bacillota bacterium]|nr:class C sortase [Bacillota bacterium]